jgi:hypothetical protein
MPCGADGSVRGVGIPSTSLGAGSSTPRTDSLCESVGCALDDILQRDPTGAEARWFSGCFTRR